MRLRNLGLTIAILFLAPAAFAQERSGLMNDFQNNMGRLSQRQGIIAKNIANANTPGYVAQDLEEPIKGHSKKRRLTLARTSPKHMSGGMASTNARLVEDTTAELKPNGNQVDLVHEVDKASQTGLDYNLTTNLYKKMSGMMKKAAGGQ